MEYIVWKRRLIHPLKILITTALHHNYTLDYPKMSLIFQTAQPQIYEDRRQDS